VEICLQYYYDLRGFNIEGNITAKKERVKVVQNASPGESDDADTEHWLDLKARASLMTPTWNTGLICKPGRV
jgi:hypothetical protein